MYDYVHDHFGARQSWLILAAAAALGACSPSDAAEPAVRTTYGEAQPVGNGSVRPYVVTRGGAPQEVGVALTEQALEGLPSVGSGHHGGHPPLHQRILPLPEGTARPSPSSS